MSEAKTCWACPLCRHLFNTEVSFQAHLRDKENCRDVHTLMVEDDGRFHYRLFDDVTGHGIDDLGGIDLKAEARVPVDLYDERDTLTAIMEKYAICPGYVKANVGEINGKPVTLDAIRELASVLRGELSEPELTACIETMSVKVLYRAVSAKAIVVPIRQTSLVGNHVFRLRARSAWQVTTRRQGEDWQTTFAKMDQCMRSAESASYVNVGDVAPVGAAAASSSSAPSRYSQMRARVDKRKDRKGK